jgi:hypothetical protein
MITVIIHAAEQRNSLEIHIGKTSFSIIKDNMYEHHKKVDCMVVGRNQQRIFQKPDLNNWAHVGKIDDEFALNQIYYLPAEMNNKLQEDSFFIGSNKPVWERAQIKKLKCQLIRIVEPRINLDPIQYYCTKDHPLKRNCIICYSWYGNDALIEASKDLEICYNNALKKGLEVLKDKKEKKIALAALSMDIGLEGKTAVPATFKAIIEFIKNNSGYASIQLFVRSDSAFDLYKQQCEEYLVQKMQD